MLQNPHSQHKNTSKTIWFTHGAIMTIVAVVFAVLIGTVYAISFSDFFSFTTDTEPSLSVITGDFNNDGFLDYFSGHSDATGNHQNRLYFSTGSLAFARYNMSGSTAFIAAAAGDVNGDGELDLVRVHGNSTLVVMTKTPATTATYTTSSYSPGGSASGITLADINNDGSLDIVLAENSNSANDVYINNGAGTFTGISTALPISKRIAVADMNNDGNLDVIVVQSDNGTATSFKQIGVYLGSGTGSFVASWNSGTAATNYTSVTTGDVDGDGDIDIVATIVDDFYVFLNNGTATSFPSTGYDTAADVAAESVVLVDLDNDGDLEATVSGNAGAGNGVTQNFLNNGGGTFSSTGSQSDADPTWRIAFGDFDNDGDLDYVESKYGAPNTSQVNRRWRNDDAPGSMNTNPSAPSTGFSVTDSGRTNTPHADTTDSSNGGTVSWGSDDNIQGDDGTYATSTMNAGETTHYIKGYGFHFNLPSSATITGIKVDVDRKGSATSAIVDQRARLIKNGTIGTTDKASATAWSTTEETVTYGGSSDLWGTTWTPSDINLGNFGFAIAATNQSASSATASIENIRITVYYGMTNVALNWGAGSDTQTSASLLQYVVKVGTTSGGNNIASGRVASPNFFLRQMANGAQKLTFPLKNLPCSQTYYWSVATVDTGYRGATGFSSEHNFTLSPSCTVSEGTSSDSGGGGVGWWVTSSSSSSSRQSVAEDPTYGFLNVTAFRDPNNDGSQGLREPSAFGGLPVTVAGTSIDGDPVKVTQNLNAAGMLSLTVPPSDTTGYTVSIDTTGKNMDDFTPSSSLTKTAIVITKNETENIDFGFHRTALLGYKPCLSITDTAVKDSIPPAAQFLGLLKLANNKGVMDGTDIGTTPLVSRRSFLRFLQRATCVPLMKNVTQVPNNLQKGSDYFARTGIRLSDLPATQAWQDDTSVMYSLIAYAAPAARKNKTGALQADLDAPVRLEEAVLLLSWALTTANGIPTTYRAYDIMMGPKEIPVQKAVDSLYDAGVLPPYMKKSFVGTSGVTPQEAMLLMARTILRAGKVDMGADIDPNVVADDGTLGGIPVPQICSDLVSDTVRTQTYQYLDLLPGAKRSGYARSLLQFGLPNHDGVTMWLSPGTNGVTEFGVRYGRGRLKNQPVSIFELIRTLLVLTCKPPETIKEATLYMLNPSLVGPDGGMRASADLISGLKRDTSFVSRVMYGAQDQEREYNLSLFSFAPELLRRDIRKPESEVSQADAARLIASAILGTAVRTKQMTSLEAENQAQKVGLALYEIIHGGPVVITSPDAPFGTEPLTRTQMIDVLWKLLISTDITTPLGDLWWYRV